MVGWAGGVFICLAEAASLYITIRSLYLCATVEPGIIPKIRSKTVNYQKTYKVAYREADEW